MNQTQLARERSARNVCIICEDDTTRITRGLCVKHHTRYVASRKKIPADRRDEYDEYLVANGLLLPSRKGRRVDPNENEFAVAVGEFLAGDDTVDSRSAQQLAAELVADAEAEQREQAARKRPAKSRAGGRKKKG